MGNRNDRKDPKQKENRQPEILNKLKSTNITPRAGALMFAALLLVVLMIFGGGGSKSGTDSKDTDTISRSESAVRESTASPESSHDGEAASADESLPADESTDTEDSALPASADSAEPSVLSEPEDSEHEGRLTELKQTLTEKLESFDGEWSCYLKDLGTNEWFDINDHIVYPASMIKLFALAACYQRIEDGLVDEDEVYSTLVSMAAMSNNQAFNMIVRKIGLTYINEWCEANGCPNTKQYHGLQPSTNYEGLETADKDNQTCARDAAHVLESIYRKECVSEYASEQMLDILFQQKFRGKLPAALPYGAECANKTGDTFDVSHDAAIVYSPNADYVLVVMAEVPDIAFEQHYRFFDISHTVYEFFNPGAYDAYE